MLSFQVFNDWFGELFSNRDTFGLPEEIYNDAVPSGMHSFNRRSG